MGNSVTVSVCPALPFAACRGKEVAPALTVIYVGWSWLLRTGVTEEHVDYLFWIKALPGHRHRQVDWTNTLLMHLTLTYTYSFLKGLCRISLLTSSKKILWSFCIAVESDSLRGLKADPKEGVEWVMTSCFLFFFSWKTFSFSVLIYEDSFAFFSGRC